MMYTANEILAAAGITDTADIFGKVRVNFGGVTLRTANQIVNVGDPTQPVKLVVGDKMTDVQLPVRDTHSAEVTAASEAKGALENVRQAAQEQVAS